MISGGRHQKKEIAAEVRRATAAGLHMVPGKSGHTWGLVTCPGCGGRFRVWCTPRSPGNHAADLARFTETHRAHLGERP